MPQMQHADETRPDALLSRMLGLDGAVTLGDQVERMGDLTPGPRDEAQLALHRQVMLTLVKRRDAIRTRVERRYAQAFEGLRPVPGAAAILEVLAAQGGLANRSPEVLAGVAHKVANRYQFLFASTLGVVRKELYWLREDSLRALHGAGPAAQQLVALDSVLDSALEQATLKAHRSLEAGVAQRFVEQLIEALLQLPQEAPTPSMEAWFVHRGFIARFMHDCRRLCWAILDSEWSRLRGLADACCGPLLQQGHGSAPPPNTLLTQQVTAAPHANEGL